MTTTELNALMLELSEAFPSVKKRLIESKRLLTEWQQALRPLDQATVSHAIGRWLHTHHTDPTLEKFLDLLDTLAAARRRAQPQRHAADPQSTGEILPQTLHEAAGWAQNDDDRAWGRLHLAMFAQGLARNMPQAAQQRAALYRKFAAQYPALAGLALVCAAQCDNEEETVPF